MMLRGKYKIIWILFAAILLDMVVATFRMISISLWLWIVPVLYFILTVWTLVYVKTIKPLYLFLTILVGLNLTNLYIRIVNFESTLFTIWCPIMGSVGVLAGYLYVKYRLKAWLALGMSAFMWIYTASVGQDQWVEYLYFGRYPVKEGIGDDAIYSTVKDSIFIRDLEYRYVVLEFWNSSCGVCFEKFPMLQQLYDNYRSRNDVLVAGIFVRFRDNEELEMGKEIMRKEGYTFPVYAVNRNSSLMLHADIRVFPTVLILDRNKTVLFKGNLDEAVEKMNTLE